MLYQFLAEHDAPCPACGYNLRQLSRPTCPECGLSLKLSVGSDEPFKRAWAITLCINAFIAGVGLFFLLLFAIDASFRDWVINDQNEPFQLLGLLAPMFWLGVPPTLVWMRRPFCRLGVKTQRLLVLLSIAWLGIQMAATIALVS